MPGMLCARTLSIVRVEAFVRHKSITFSPKRKKKKHILVGDCFGRRMIVKIDRCQSKFLLVIEAGV